MPDLTDLDAGGSILSLVSIGSIVSVLSVGSIGSVASVGSIASVGSVGSIASVGRVGAVLNYPVAARALGWAWRRWGGQRVARVGEAPPGGPQSAA